MQRLKKVCEDKGVMRKHLSVRMQYALNPLMEYEDLELDDKEVILEERKTMAHDRFPELLTRPDHVLAEPLPLTASDSLKAAMQLTDDDPNKRELARLANKEDSIDHLMQEADDSMGKADFVNRWLLQELRLSPLNVLLLHSTFVTSQSLKIRDPWRWQLDVLHYWWRDVTTTKTAEQRAPHLMTSIGSNFSSRPRAAAPSPPMSRAASDSGVRTSRPPALLAWEQRRGDCLRLWGRFFERLVCFVGDDIAVFCFVFPAMLCHIMPCSSRLY